MGCLIDGKWQQQNYNTSAKGEFLREPTHFHHLIGGADTRFSAEANRYHLYVSLACPWAHRTLIMRKLKQLEPLIGVSIVHPDMLDHGWTFTTDDTASGDKLYDLSYLHQLYCKAKADYSGRVTVPVLWDTKHQTIVNNESSQIIRIFNSAFNALTGNTLDFYPAALQSEIDTLNDWIYQTINNGVYRCGFANSQAAYEQACMALFTALDELETRFANQTYLIGDQLTEADWRLFTTLIRFDAVYYCHFKTNLKRLIDYPNLSRYLKQLYQHPGIAETVHFEHIKRHYYFSHRQLNPKQIVPLGPEVLFTAT